MNGLLTGRIALTFSLCWAAAILPTSLHAQTHADLSLQVEATQLDARSGVVRVTIDNLGPDDLVLLHPSLPNHALRLGTTIEHFRSPTEPFWNLTRVIEGADVCFIRGFFFGSPGPDGRLFGSLGVTGPIMRAGEQRICTFRYEISPRLGNAPLNGSFILGGTVGNQDPDLSNNRQTVSLRGTAPVAIPVNRGIGVLLALTMLIGGLALYRRRRALSTS